MVRPGSIETGMTRYSGFEPPSGPVTRIRARINRINISRRLRLPCPAHQRRANHQRLQSRFLMLTAPTAMKGQMTTVAMQSCTSGRNEGWPAVDLSHGDLARGEQRPEQHGRGRRRGQDGLGLDPPLELLMQPLDRIGRPG